MARLSPGLQASHEVSRLRLQGLGGGKRHPVPTHPGTGQRTNPEALQGRGFGAGAPWSSSRVQQPPLGYCTTGSRPEEGPGGEGCC
ncbi:hypothetical protein LIER_17529 [Lithospermum erythrorhizon]|uniref:Uncharacterized protein n=1 Tax=Lithospermum erythrorhizon TaxID=34254 RepID=A0AAV3QAQ3_LITER